MWCKKNKNSRHLPHHTKQQYNKIFDIQQIFFLCIKMHKVLKYKGNSRVPSIQQILVYQTCTILLISSILHNNRLMNNKFNPPPIIHFFFISHGWTNSRSGKRFKSSNRVRSTFEIDERERERRFLIGGVGRD